MKVLIIVGARPNFIKITPLFKEFNRYNSIKLILVHTGQHYDFEMSQIFFKDFKIPKPNYNLGIGSGSHSWQTAKIMEKLEPIILREKPNLVIVVGDVNSTLAGSLVAAKINIPLAHIEAGLRSYQKTMPEEINRLLTDQVSTFLFCPTETAIQNLKKENITKNVYNVGDVMYDTLINSKSKIKKLKLLKELELKPKQYLLLTVHRASNTDSLENLKRIITAVGESREKVVFPIHPRTKKQLKKIKLKIKNCKLKIIPPLSYLNMLILEKNAKKIITDSGGVQKEAYWLKIPCITLRNETEWIETVKDGWNILVGQNKAKILEAIRKFQPNNPQHHYFGNGKSAIKTINIIRRNFL